MALFRALVVEDDLDIARLMALHLEREGFRADCSVDGTEALRRLGAQAYDILILDWMLPGISGADVCRRLRADLRLMIPILMVTAKTQASDIVLGLEIGADDYLTKPFELSVLLARVRSLLRRATVSSQGDRIAVGVLEIRVAEHRIFVDRREVTLTASEFKLLEALARNAGRVLTRDRLIDCVMGAGISVSDRTIDTHVFGLRAKLGPGSHLIETVRGIGYRVRAAVSTQS